jgi:hypothetical protein
VTADDAEVLAAGERGADGDVNGLAESPGERVVRAMAATLEDHERRIAALELTQSAKSENAIKRIEEKVDALHHVAAEMIAESEQRIRAEMRGETRRLDDRISASERRIVDTLNDRFDAVMAAFDRIASPPK